MQCKQFVSFSVSFHTQQFMYFWRARNSFICVARTARTHQKAQQTPKMLKMKFDNLRHEQFDGIWPIWPELLVMHKHSYPQKRISTASHFHQTHFFFVRPFNAKQFFIFEMNQNHWSLTAKIVKYGADESECEWEKKRACLPAWKEI